MKALFLIFYFFIIITSCTNKFVKSSLFVNKVSITDLLPHKMGQKEYSIISPKVNGNYFVSILSAGGRKTDPGINYFLIIDLAKKELINLIENPVYGLEKYPLFDYANDSLRVVSFLQKRIYNINGVTEKYQFKEININMPYGEFNFFSSKSILSKSPKGILILDSVLSVSAEIDNLKVTHSYYSDFSKPFNSNLYLYGSKFLPDQDSIELLSSKGWHFRLPEKKLFEDNNFQIYYHLNKFLIIRNSLLTILDATQGEVLYNHEFGFGQITSYQLLKDDLLLSFTDSTSHRCYSFHIPDNQLKLISDQDIKATHIVDIGPSYIGFQKSGVWEINKENSNQTRLRSDLENHFNSIFLYDALFGKRYYLDKTSIYW